MGCEPYGRPFCALDAGQRLSGIRQRILDMCAVNPLWGAPRIHGELLKLGIDVSQTTGAKYSAKRAATVAGGGPSFVVMPMAVSACYARQGA
jgi:hypothetical protein